MAAVVWRDDDGHLRCRRSPGGTQWYVRTLKAGSFALYERLGGEDFAAGDGEEQSPDAPEGRAGAAAGARIEIGRIDPETAERIIRFLVRERQQG